MPNRKHRTAVEPAHKSPEAVPPARILYLSDDCAVVNKLSGEAVEGAGPGMNDLPRMLAAALDMRQPGAVRCGGFPSPVAAHRLDVPVTGCVVYALTRSALGFLSAAFSGNGGPGEHVPVPAVEKHYWAITEMPSGTMPIPEAGELIHWIHFDSRKNKSIAYNEPGPGRKKAILKYRLAGRGQRYLFVEVQLITGRHHQIRAQLARLGLHIKGDLKYGAARSEPDGGIRLHARSVSFPDPSEPGRRITVQADPPVQDNLWAAFAAAV